MDIEYKENEKILKLLYDEKGISEYFDSENQYVKTAFKKINDLWFENYEKIKKVNYVMIAEAPLWGDDETYIYNPNTKNSSVFSLNNLNVALNVNLQNKKQFIDKLDEIGFIIVDIFPYPLNSKSTHICYRKNKKQDCVKLGSKDYTQILNKTIPYFFEKKMNLLSKKQSHKSKFFFRYSRVLESARKSDLIDFVKRYIKSDIGSIHSKGFGIDQANLNEILKEKF